MLYLKSVALLVSLLFSAIELIYVQSYMHWHLHGGGTKLSSVTALVLMDFVIIITPVKVDVLQTSHHTQGYLACDRGV